MECFDRIYEGTLKAQRSYFPVPTARYCTVCVYTIDGPESPHYQHEEPYFRSPVHFQLTKPSNQSNTHDSMTSLKRSHTVYQIIHLDCSRRTHHR